MKFNGFILKPNHLYGVDSRGLYVTGGVCEFKGNEIVGIRVYRMVRGEWLQGVEVPPADSIELLQVMFASEQRKLEGVI